ncbi:MULTISPECIES: Cro/CI family transcriptional regulator [Acinetobacter]|jgi:hypothetical protein|uniref:Cro/CI family transcriptional regulator n=1 Tax=Acinetobacter TaxID=469 RepID=UPI00124F944C|nr:MULTISPECIES: Cro/CI family transcriptional regulator [Acinetobacter]NAR86437.1 hypothetical protein [Acinetobacter haemolyticus]
MTVDDLVTHFKVAKDIELTAKLNVTRGTVSKWRSKGIPRDTQARIQILTKGKLKADLQALSA